MIKKLHQYDLQLFKIKGQRKEICKLYKEEQFYNKNV